MTFSSEPPLVTSQMAWWEASLWFAVLPLACLLCRWFVRGPMAHTFRNSHTLRIGIGIAGLLLAGGFISAGHALRKLLNYTRIEKEGIRQVGFLQKDKHQRWDEFVVADLQDWKVLKARTSDEL